MAGGRGDGAVGEHGGAQEAPAVEAAPATIERFNEGTNFYNVIAIPQDAEILHLSGAGANPKENGRWGTM